MTTPQQHLEEIRKEIKLGKIEHSENPNRINELAQMLRTAKLSESKFWIEQQIKILEEEVKKLKALDLDDMDEIQMSDDSYLNDYLSKWLQKLNKEISDLKELLK